jgi:hypothetical protein
MMLNRGTRQVPVHTLQVGDTCEHGVVAAIEQDGDKVTVITAAGTYSMRAYDLVWLRPAD